VKEREGQVELRPAQRRLVASLLLNPGGWVSTDALIDRMWGERPPGTARDTLHVHLSAVRRRIPDLIASGSDGYLLDLADQEFDVTEFSRIAVEAAADLERGRFREATELAEQGLALWRGVPYHELDEVDSARIERSRLIETSTSISITLARGLMLQGRVSESIVHLRGMVAEHPFNEAMWEELIQAYYLAGRQVDALRAYDEAKTVLGEELGLEPGPRLRALEEKVLVHDPMLLAGQTSATPNNLPGLTSSFVGRDRDIDQVLGLLDEHRLVTVTGAPGIGKTRLAIEIGARALDSFPGGVWLARLAEATTESDAIAIISSALGVVEHIEAPEELRDQVAGRSALLVLDNCEHMLPALRPFVAHRPKGGRLKVLATSRTRIGVDDEVVWPLRELPLPGSIDDMWESPAIRLLTDRIRNANAAVSIESLNPNGLVELCAKAAGIPLALELAARWVPAFDLATVPSLTFSSPVAQAEGEPAHHASLAEAIAWSSGMLNDRVRWAFEAASLFASGFNADAFARVCVPRASEDRAAAVLGKLIEASLLEVERDEAGHVRYRMLEPLREYGRARLAAKRRTRAVADRHSDWFLGLATKIGSEAFGPDEAEASRRGRGDISDFRNAMKHQLERGRADEAAQIASGLTQVWIGQYLGWEGHRWLEACLGHNLSEEVRIQTVSAAGGVCFYIGEYDRSFRYYEQLGELAGGDTALQAESRYGMGRVEIHRDPERGSRLLREAIPKFEEVGEVVRSAECRIILGIQDAYGARAAEARSNLTRALNDLEVRGDQKLSAVAHRHLSMVEWYENDQAAARHNLEIAEQLALASNDRRVYSGVLTQKALVEGTWGSPSAAAEAILESLEIISDQHNIYFCLVAFGALPVLMAAERWELAARLLGHFDRVYQDYGWIKLDRRVAAAPGYRRTIASALARSESNHSAMSSVEVVDELVDVLSSLSATTRNPA
jgi:predicted ATPase/DNA-binding SARP family transcriptional activator